MTSPRSILQDGVMHEPSRNFSLGLEAPILAEVLVKQLAVGELREK